MDIAHLSPELMMTKPRRRSTHNLGVEQLEHRLLCRGTPAVYGSLQVGQPPQPQITVQSGHQSEADGSFMATNATSQLIAASASSHAAEEFALLSASTFYRPLTGTGVNLKATGVSHNPTGSPDQWVRVGVNLTSPQRDRGGFAIRLFWEDGLGRRRFAGYKEFIKSTTPAWGPNTFIKAAFERSEVQPQPAGTRALIAVVDPDNATSETSEYDNAVAMDLATGQSQPLVVPAAQPRTFVFLLGGFLSTYTAPTGMDRLAAAIKADGRLGQFVYSKNGVATGPAIINDDRVFIDNTLRAAGYTPADRVLLVGHSLGGDAAHQLAVDVSSSTPGAQPAHVLVTIDPIRFQKVQETGSTDQSSLVYAPPAGLTLQTVLNLFQRGGSPQGYTIQGAINERQDPRGADKRSGTSDDITHTSIDDVESVHLRVIKFLVSGGREMNNTLASQARFDADAKADTTVWRPSEGNWFITQSSNGLQRAEQWGLPGDVPVNGDFDGDGRSDKAVWRPSTGTWYVVSSATGQAFSRQWGLPGDDPVPGDFDGDGQTDFAVWRRSNQTWYIRSAMGTQWEQRWGLSVDVPVSQDYDGDGRTDIAVWRPATGTWYVWRSLGGTMVQQWGLPGDVPVPGDYDGDGRSDLAVYRPSNATWWVINSSTQGAITRQWGLPGDVPQPADFDGDGRLDFAVWRPKDGNWFVIQSSDGIIITRQWGLPGDFPVANAYARYLASRQ